MSVLMAVGNIIGAIIVLVAFGIGTLLLAGWQRQRTQKMVLEEVSLALRIPVDDFESTEHLEKIIQFSTEKFSPELFRNRLSDLCGLIQIVWDWASNLLQASVLIGVIWFTIKDGPSNSVYAWWIVGIAFLFWLSSMIFGYTCKLLTGRYPGQAKSARKYLAVAIENQRATKHAHSVA